MEDPGSASNLIVSDLFARKTSTGDDPRGFPRKPIPASAPRQQRGGEVLRMLEAAEIG